MAACNHDWVEYSRSVVKARGKNIIIIYYKCSKCSVTTTTESTA